MIQHRGPVSGVDAWGACWVATAGYDNQVILWEAATKKSIARALHDHLANQCRFSACGRLLVTSSSDYSARVWSVPSLRLLALLGDHDDDVEMAVPSPDGTRIATACRDHIVRIFKLSAYAGMGAELIARLHGHEADVLSVEWIEGGAEVVSSGDDGTVRKWRAVDGALIETVDLGGVESDTVVVVGTDRLIVGNDRGELLMIDPCRNGHRGLRTIPAHDAGIKRLIYDAASRSLVSASYDRSVKFWSVPGYEPVLRREIEAPASVWLRSSAFAGHGRLVFGTFGSSYAAYDFAHDVWDLTTVEPTPGVNAVAAIDDSIYTVGDAGRVERDGRLVSSLGSLCNFLLPIGGRLLAGGHLGVVFDALDGRPVYRHSSPLNCAATFRVGGELHCIVGTYTGEGLVLRIDSGGGIEHVTTLALHDNAVKGLACNDRHIFSVCATGAAALHAIDTFACDHYLAHAHSKISNGVACLADGRFATVSRDRRLRFFRQASSIEIPTPHHHSVKCVAACHASGIVATGSYDGTVALYDPARAIFVHTERPTASGISSLVASDVPGVFFAGSYDGRVYRVGTQSRDTR
jgi:toxoflavin biosynthesis protein ToxC